MASPSFGGSIVINDKLPQSALQYQDDQGRVQTLPLTWSDVKTNAKVKKYLIENYGDAGKDMAYMIDRASQTVRVLVDRSKGHYETVSFADLKDL